MLNDSLLGEAGFPTFATFCSVHIPTAPSLSAEPWGPQRALASWAPTALCAVPFLGHCLLSADHSRPGWSQGHRTQEDMTLLARCLQPPERTESPGRQASAALRTFHPSHFSWGPRTSCLQCTCINCDGDVFHPAFKLPRRCFDLGWAVSSGRLTRSKPLHRFIRGGEA